MKYILPKDKARTATSCLYICVWVPFTREGREPPQARRHPRASTETLSLAVRLEGRGGLRLKGLEGGRMAGIPSHLP